MSLTIACLFFVGHLCSMILFEVWQGEKRQLSIYEPLALRALGETGIIWRKIIVSTADTISWGLTMYCAVCQEVLITWFIYYL